MTWNQLWHIFQAEHILSPHESKGVSIMGYWNAPYLYWNETGVYPGIVETGIRSRYGFMDKDNWLWLSEYVSGASRIKIQHRGRSAMSPKSMSGIPAPDRWR